MKRGGKNKQKSVTLAAEKASTPKHSKKRRICMSTVLAGMEFTGENSEYRQIEKKSIYFTSRQVNLGCTSALEGRLLS